MKDSVSEAARILLYEEPDAIALLSGSDKYPSIRGMASLYSFWQGTLVSIMVAGLPFTDAPCSERFFAFHLHNKNGHYNPENCSHPMHAGDFPVLLGNHGCALMVFYTERILPEQAAGKTLVIHANADDFHTQPSGNAGEQIATGEVYLNSEIIPR